MPPGEESASEEIEYYNGTFLNERKMNLYCYYWKPHVEPRGLLLISHGYTEHSILYEDLAKYMCKLGFFVFAHDHECHGHSDGERAFITNINDLVRDTVTHIKIMRKDYPDLPLFICGHSLGGQVAILTSLEKELDVKGLVLIAPAVATNPETATSFRLCVAKLMNKFFPHFPIAPTDFRYCCRNEEKVEFMKNDALRYKGWWKVRPVLTLIEGSDEVSKKFEEVKVPFLLLHGDNDLICHIDGATQLYEKAKSTDKTFQVYPGGYHSLLNEPEEISKDCFNRIVKWLDAKA